MSVDRLGIVIPFYNEAAALPGTLNALYAQEKGPTPNIILVDNGSTDASRQVIQNFQDAHLDLPLRVIEETRKGTGTASDTGFREAIKLGHVVIARTDADTHPRKDWVRNISQHMEQRPSLQLLGGITRAIHDEHYRVGDALIAPFLGTLGRAGLSLHERSLWPLRGPLGHNMAVRSGAYEQVGGFPHSKIEETDEDKVLAKAIYKKYGFAAMKIAHDVRVNSSARRLRKIGSYTDIFRYYISHDSDYRLDKVDGDIDIR